MSEKKPAKKPKAEAKVNDFLSAVMYCDGGANPGNPGPAGYGVHMYLWDTYNVNLNLFRKGKRATVQGYADNDSGEEKKRVSPCTIINACGVVTPGYRATNNAAELMACIHGLNILVGYKAEKEVKEVLVFSDSEYMLGKLETIRKTPPDRRRIALTSPNRNGQPRPNQTETLNLLLAYEALEHHSVKITSKWIKGHSGNTGNELADTFATFGTRHANQLMCRAAHLLPNNEREHVSVMSAEEFWHGTSENIKEIPLIAHTNIAYAYNSEDYVPRKVMLDGTERYVYMVSSEADEYREEKKAPPRSTTEDSDDDEDDDDKVYNELAGENSVTNTDYPKVAGRLAHYKARTTRALVFLNKPLDVVDELMDIYREHIPLRDFVFNDLVLFKANTITNANYLLSRSLCGTAAVVMQDNYLDKSVYPLSRASMYFDNDYLALHVNPQKISLFILEHFCEINKCATEYFNNDRVLAGVDDITDTFYTVDPEGNTVLRPEFKVGHRRTPVIHKTTDGDGVAREVPINLVSNIHIPDRNSLKRLEEYHPKIKLVTKILNYDTNAFCSYIFYVVIESDIGIGFYMAEMSNMIISKLTSQ